MTERFGVRVNAYPFRGVPPEAGAYRLTGPPKFFPVQTAVRPPSTGRSMPAI